MYKFFCALIDEVVSEVGAFQSGGGMQLFKIFVVAFVVVALISCAWLLIRQDEFILVGLPIFVLLGSILLWVKISDKTR